MREIKFRAFVKPIQRFANRQVGFMIDVSEIDFNERYVADDDGSVYLFDEVELIQYTGMKDRGRLEIYDGDIISFTERTVNGGEFTYVCTVFQHERGTWRVEGSCVGFKEESKTRRDLASIRNFCEVIGNRYENPELLKEEPTC